jgi:hypothetical protein
MTRADKSSIAKVILFLASIAFAVPASAQDLALEDWVRSQLTKEKPEQVTILDQAQWPYAPQPNTYVILVVARQKPDKLDPALPTGIQEHQDCVVLLAQSSSSGELANPKTLGSHTLYSYTTLAGWSPRKWIDVGAYQIRADEYAFGIRTVADELVGNKGGIAFEDLSLFRYESSTVKEIFDEVLWAYNKYSEPGFRSCNTETAIAAEPSPQTEFFTITRKHSRSYLGDSRMYPTLRADQEPIELCHGFEKLQLPNIHTWDPSQGRYTDPEFAIRHQDPGKGGSPYGK